MSGPTPKTESDAPDDHARAPAGDGPPLGLQDRTVGEDLHRQDVERETVPTAERRSPDEVDGPVSPSLS